MTGSLQTNAIEESLEPLEEGVIISDVHRTILFFNAADEWIMGI